MRLFVALTPPEEVAEELRAATAVLAEIALGEPVLGEPVLGAGLAPGLRWTLPEQWHVTLVFLGEVSDDTLDELTRRLGRAAARHSPLSLALGAGGRFGNRVLWTRVQGDRDGLRRLADSTAAAARRSRLPVADRPYRPHLTLARSAGETDLRPLVQRLASWQSSTWVATQLHLVRSRLGAAQNGSSRYEQVADWPLSGIAPQGQQ